MINLILLTFGERLENHYQAVFSILTYLKDPLIKRVIVVTDRREFYTWLQNEIEIIEINQTVLNEWQGAHQFFWRVKIKALEAVQQKYPQENLLYVDSDTFLAGELSAMQAQLSQGVPFMHKAEWALNAQKDKTLKKMHRTLCGKTVADIRLTDQTTMWNAGVIALPADKAEAMIALTLQACDEMCATDSPKRLLEQFAFSVALNHLGSLQPCDKIIGHYWGNKIEWNQSIAEFLLNAQLTGRSVTQCVESLREFDWSKLPLTKKQRSTNEKLKGLIDKFFRPKNISYFS
ncbi:hypothetical protein [Caviibacterium pharyngocola]|uniref:Glycosyl transferase n=1 Tax=Caviibacterium pharyngocola TaxID=28159 RepID=A0A2M8RYF0_9PAST|nr:hypothetical protein [Caviibacterium pharyngocola]PJG83902.1 hypothetical protein CVP04_02080 [Caviibacterium pharyngocola]